MSYDTKRQGHLWTKKKSQGLNWTYDYKSGAFMHISQENMENTFGFQFFFLILKNTKFREQ